MKKLLCILLLLSVCIGTTTANPISFGIGNYSRHLESVYDGLPEETIFDPSFYRFGTDVRLKIFFMEMTMNGVFGNSNGIMNSWYDGIMTLGVHAPLFGIFDLGIGIGPYYAIRYDQGEAISYRHYIKEDDPDSWWYTQAEDFGEILGDSIMGYRMHMDMHLGKLSFGVSVDAPTVGYSLNNGDFEAMDMNLQKMRIGTSVMYWLF